MTETKIVSFVLRFIQEETAPAPEAQPWRGVIRHVQSRQEVRFTRVDEALAFIARYMDLSEQEESDDV